MEQAAKYIFLFLISTTLLNFGIAIGARVNTAHKAFNELIVYWVFLFITFLAIPLLGQSEEQIALSYFFQFLPSFVIAKILLESRGLRFNLPYYLTMQGIGSLASLYLLFISQAGFTLSLLPVTFTTCLPFWPGIWNVWISHRQEANWIEKGMGLLFIAGIINHFNFAFFRLDSSTAWWGWSVSVAQYQCLSIFLPLIINARREKREKEKLESALENLTGQDTDKNKQIDDLYQNLENKITEKRVLTEKLQRTNLHLEDEREINELLIKSISHDLANPLTVINAYVSMIQSGRIPESDRDNILDRIKMNSKSAQDMITRIRTAIFTRNKANLLTLHDVSLDRAINNLLIQFEYRLRDKNITVNYENEVPDNIFVVAEETTLTEHVLSNILSNAIKFSHNNSRIKISVTDQDENLQIKIRDYGVGIGKDLLKKRFLQSTEGTEGETGSGFGMMIMSYFLHQFGGRYEMHSEGPGQGTTVTIKLKKSNAYLPNLNEVTASAQIFS